MHFPLLFEIQRHNLSYKKKFQMVLGKNIEKNVYSIKNTLLLFIFIFVIHALVILSRLLQNVHNVTLE